MDLWLFLSFTLLPGLTLLFGIIYALVEVAKHGDEWLALSSLLLIFMFFHQFLEANQLLRYSKYDIFVSREILETCVNIGGTFVILLLARSRFHYQLAQEELVETKQALEEENQRREEHADRLQDALNEKKKLLEEINHRVKNNLQLVESLLDMESRQSASGSEFLDDLASRVRTMALLHEQLQNPVAVDELAPGRYFQNLVEKAIESHASDPDHIESRISVDVPDLSLERAIPCGLIVNELVSNALKHGIADSGGEVEVVFQQTDDFYQLEVTDSGGGLSEDFEFLSKDSLGLTLVRSLVSHELSGTVSVNSNEQTTFSIEFPRSE